MSCATELTLQVEAESMVDRQQRQSTGNTSTDAAMMINEDFAAQLEHVVDAKNMLPEPVKAREYGNWMIWTVHRAFINDPTLLELDFTSMHMPPGRIEKRIAPKLMQAMATNTHLEVLSLSNSNLERAEGLLLAESLKQNVSLLELNLESNWLDSSTVRELAESLQSNRRCSLEHFRVSHQKQMGQFFGRPTEKAIGEMMQTNETIVKLGFDCDDAHWRNEIDRALLRNNDFWRRRQNAAPDTDDTPAAEEKSLGHLTLQAPSSNALPSKLFPADSPPHLTFREYVIQTRRFPTTSQLQNCSRNSGMPMTYSVAAPLIKECRSIILDHALNSKVIVRDPFGTDIEGTLRSWKENNEQWTLEVSAEEGKRYVFKSRKDPSFAIEEPWAAWLCEGARRSSIGMAGA